MRRLFWHWFISAIALMLTAAALQISIRPWWNALWLAPLFGVVNGVVGALAGVISFIALPVNMLTLGCFGFVVSFLLNVAALFFLCGPTGPFHDALPVASFPQAALFSVILALFSTVLNMVLPGKGRR
jgi:uncharacterized membrane protein YvlD (DUF360 family)